MARRKERERLEARRLRALGWPLRRIANEVGAALASVSVWVRDVEDHRAQAPISEHATDPPQQDGGALRRCGRCCETLPLHHFNRSGTGHQWWCRECFRLYFRHRGDLHRRQSGAARRRRQEEARAFMLEYLDGQACCDCGEDDIVALEFDHLAEKRGNVPLLVAGGLSLRRLREEIAICEIVCVNCHRRRTASRDGWRRSSADWRSVPTSRLARETANIDYLYGVLERSGCADCGTTELCVLDFDHVGEKTANVMTLARNGYSRGRIDAELACCEVRCANCHRRRTARNGPYRFRT